MEVSEVSKITLSREQKQIIVNLVELLFGTEAFRSPSTLVETNMMLDLIIEDPKSYTFEKAFTGMAGNGGLLSYTMKASEGSGGIICGRKLSKEFDCMVQESGMRLKTHKYGGPFNAIKKDFEEYKARKANVARSWRERCVPPETREDLALSISNSRAKWYGADVQEVGGQG